MEALVPHRATVLCALLLLLLNIVVNITIATATKTTTSSPLLKVIQQAARDGTTRSITLLSSGYSHTEEKQFDNDVMILVETLLGKNAVVDAAPWSRYAPLINIYSVFEPSIQSGASRRGGYRHNCTRMHSCPPKQVDNNLRCSFGTPDPSVLSCDRDAVLSLATHAPAQDILAVLVNEPNEVAETSGTGIAIFTNAPSFLPFFTVRGLSVAFASLASEYVCGLEEKNSVPVPNCAASLSDAKRMWSDWINAGLGDPTPVRGCFFDNYYRLTNNGCMLYNSSVNVLCPVCREAVNMALLRNAPPQFLALTRCPPNGYTVHVGDKDSLFLNVGALGGAPGVKVTWRHENDSPVTLNSGAVIVIDAETLKTWSLPTVVKVTLEDKSPFVGQRLRSKLFNVEMSFSVAKKDINVHCKETKCGNTESMCLSCSGDRCNTTVPASPRKISWKSEGDTVTYGDYKEILAASICSVIAFGLLLILVLAYLFCYHQLPHEVIAGSFRDLSIRILLAFFCICIIVAATVIMVYTLRFSDQDKFLGTEVLLPSLVLGSITYAAALINFATALFSLYILALICGIVFFVLGHFVMGIGIFFLLIYARPEDDNLVPLVAYYWSYAAKHNPSAVCNEQWTMSCSGFYVSCLQVNGSYCPSDCKSNAFAEPCRTPFMEKLSLDYLNLGVSAVVLGSLMVIFAWLNALYYARFRHLSLIGRRRRRLRRDPCAPILPFTFSELTRVKCLFNNIASKSDMTLTGPQCASFLRKVFNQRLDQAYENDLRAREPMDCDSLMQLHFPYFNIRRMDPRQLTPDEANKVSAVVDLQRLQYQKLELFMSAAGVLSPEALYLAFQKYALSRFIPNQEELLESLKREEEELCDAERDMFRGLTPGELEGLRSAWVSLHPRLLGRLSDEEIDLFFQWTHDRPLESSHEFYQWKNTLDVQNHGSIGWAEFCYPFAQRALLRDARVFLGHLGLDVPPELLTRTYILDRFGEELTQEIFLPFENCVPIERVLECLLRKWKKINPE